MSDVVVSVVESNTAVTVTEQDVAVDVTENNVVVSVSTAGIQGVPGANNDPTYVTVRNATGATLAKGTIVYISGANGNNVQVSPALATGDSTSARTIGWLAASIPNNGSGLCMVEGYLEGINTQGFTAGAQLYLSGTTAGAFTATKPVAPIHLVYVGVVTKVSAGDGHVFVKVQNGYELEELHNVQITNPTNAQVLAYDSATQLWKNATNAPDGVTSITATAPLTGGTITSTGSIGLDQTALSITKSQVSDFTSGTVTSASTAQQAGTAVYSVNSGTAVYATTSGTAVTISGSITKSQVSDFTSGTVASAGTAQQAGTAVYALTSGTATYADTSGTATYATNAGTAVFATNASTAVTISGSITQSQVTNLTTDLAGKANLAGGNAFTGAQTVTGTATGSVVAILAGVAGQTADLLDIRNSSAVDLFSISSAGLITAKVVGNAANQSRGLLLSNTADTWQSGLYLRSDGSGFPRLSLLAPTGALGEAVSIDSAAKVGIGNIAPVAQLDVYSQLSTRVGQVIRGAASQTADLLQVQNSASTLLSGFDSGGKLYIGASNPTGASVHVSTGNAARVGQVIQAVASQSADQFQIRDSSSGVLGGVNANAQIFTGLTAPIQTAVGAGINGVSGNGTLVTFSTTNAHGLANGDRVTIAGLTPAGYNGTYIISGVSTFSFNVANTTTGTATGSGTVSVDSQASITARSAGTNPLIVRGATSQVANLIEARQATGDSQFSVSANGSIIAYGANLFQSFITSRVPVSVRGAASQSANLQEWQSSAGVILARVDSVGDITARVQRSTFAARFTTTDPSIAIQVNTGAASQTGDFFQTQTSTGTVMQRLLADGGANFAQGNATISSGGVIRAVQVNTISDLATIREANSGGFLRMTRQTAALTNPGANIGGLYFRDGTNAGTLKLVVRAGAAGAETTILDNIPQ